MERATDRESGFYVERVSGDRVLGFRVLKVLRDGVVAESRAGCIAECDYEIAAHRRARAGGVDHAECAHVEHDVQGRAWGGICVIQGGRAHELGADGFHLADDFRPGVLRRGDDAYGRCSVRFG